MRTLGRITGWAALAVLLVAFEGSASPQRMNDVADQLISRNAATIKVMDKASTDGSFIIAQTRGQDRRGDRQDCRQQEGAAGADKRNCKQEGRQTR